MARYAEYRFWSVRKVVVTQVACCHGSRGKAGQLISFCVLSNVEKVQFQSNTLLLDQKHKREISSIALKVSAQIN